MKKGYYARQALRKLGVGRSVGTKDTQDALIELEMMMANLDGRGIRLGYQFAEDRENVDPEQESNTPDTADDGIIYLLAKRLAADYGRPLSAELMAQASGSLSTFYFDQDLPRVNYPSRMPIGSGNRRCFRYRKYFRPTSNITVENALDLTSNTGTSFTTGPINTTPGTDGCKPPVEVPDCTPITTAPTLLIVPSCSAEPVGQVELDLSWNSVVGAEEYVVAGTSPSRPDINVTTTGLGLTLFDVGEDITYTFVIFGQSSCATGPNSTPNILTTPFCS